MRGKTEMFLKKPVWQLEQYGWFLVQEETRGSLELLPWEGAALTWIHSCGHKAQHREKETELTVSANLSQGERESSRIPKECTQDKSNSRVLVDIVL